MQLGVAYYPEHWSSDRWATDARMMREAGLSVVRLAEFAWAVLEPEQGKFDFSLFDRAIDRLASEALQVVFSTPTAAPPAWLAADNPDILPVLEDGRMAQFGGRRHYCPSSPVYRTACKRIVQAVATHYGAHPAVIGWQIDNELGNHGTARCYCATCRAAFQEWLQRKYGSLNTLNQAWGTIFWSQIYNDWRQIPLPMKTVVASHNPSLSLDYRRFASDQIVDFMQAQIGIVRSCDPGAFITTNLIPQDDQVNFYDLAAPLDFISWDNYPHGNNLPGETAFNHDFFWGAKQKPYWIMEQQPGPINWTPYNPPVPPGQVREWTLEAREHGAEAVVYFRWRAGTVGSEQYHSGLLRHDARPDRAYGEVQKLARELPELGTFTRKQASVALLWSYDDLWAVQLEPHNSNFNYRTMAIALYESLRRRGVQVDVIRKGCSLDGYKIVLAPCSLMMNPRLIGQWEDYVSAGGTLLALLRLSTCTERNTAAETSEPSGLTRLFGVEVAETLSLPPDMKAHVSTGAGPIIEGRLWAEVLSPHESESLWRYSSDYYAGGTALSYKSGANGGGAYYLGVYPTPDVLDTLWSGPLRAIIEGNRQ